ncbi:condensation domain-containing protein, partial [Bacillus atrophaeus]
LGVDSIQIVEIKHNIEKDLGVIISEVVLLEDITLNNLSKKILEKIHEKILISQMGKLKKVNSVDDEHPLSYNQKTMWYLQELSPNNSAYNISFALTFKSSININRFKDSIQRLLERHPILRTIYHQREERPVQKILKDYNFRVETLKCANWSERQLKEEVNRIAQLPFNVKKDIPIRVFLLEKNNKETVALFTFHHIAVDLWSITLIMNELEELYLTDFNEKSSGQTSNLYNYIDYVYWQKEMLENSNEEKLISYWEKKLDGDLPVLELPTDYLRPNIQTYKGKKISFEINLNVTEKLKKLAKFNGTTLNNILMAAYKVWLHKYTGQDDLLVGIPSAGRGLQQLNNVVGYFVNPLVVRTDFSGNPTFVEVLNRVKRNMLDAITHQDYPFPLLVEKLKVRRDNSRHPIFQTMFVMQALHKKRELSDFILGKNKQQENYLNISVESFPVETNASQLDLTLKMVETPKGLRALFEYNTDLFKQSTIEKMSKHLINILENISIKPDEKIGNYSLLTQEEEKIMLKKCNNTAVNYPKNTSLSTLFEEQVNKTPDNIAVVYKQQTVTYRKLNKQANQLARVLREKGIQPDVIVGIMAERSVEMIVGILAVLKAGGTYLPIDPEYPVERIEYMMEDSQASVLLTQEHLLDQITFNKEVLNIEDERLYQGDCSNLEPVNSPNDLAYIIYTSGTTGNAKGVMIEHKNVVRLLFNDHKLFDFNEGDIWTLFHSFCFDFSVWEMYGALLYGGRIVVVPKLITQDPKQFLELLKAEKVTVLNQTPTAFYHLIAQETKVPDRELALRYVIFGGEALHPIQLRAWWGKYPNVKLINMYGITETTVH